MGREINTHVKAFQAQLDKLHGDDDFVPFNLACVGGRQWGFAYPRVCFSPVLRLGYKIKEHL